MATNFALESARRSNYTSYPSVTAGAHSDEANKPSLPSISNLLGIADGDRGSERECKQEDCGCEEHHN